MKQNGSYKEKEKRFLIERYASLLGPAVVSAVLHLDTNKSAVVMIIVMITIALMVLHHRRWSENGVYAAFIYEHEYGSPAPKGWFFKWRLKEGFKTNVWIIKNLFFGGLGILAAGGTKSKADIEREQNAKEEKEYKERREQERKEMDKLRESYKGPGTGY